MTNMKAILESSCYVHLRYAQQLDLQYRKTRIATNGPSVWGDPRGVQKAPGCAGSGPYTNGRIDESKQLGQMLSTC